METARAFGKSVKVFITFVLMYFTKVEFDSHSLPGKWKNAS